MTHTPNYTIDSDLAVHVRGMKQGHTKNIPAGSYVRPIRRAYVPEHVLEWYIEFDNFYYEFCYTHYGIVPIPKTYLRSA